MTDRGLPPISQGDDSQKPPQGHEGALIYRQSIATRLTHWVWAICLFFLLLSGLQIFNAHPTLYFGQQSGFDFNNAFISMEAKNSKGVTTVLGRPFDTTGVLGLSTQDGQPAEQGFPGWATIPSRQDLATGRVVHFFFAWIFVLTLFVWLVASLINGHFRRDIVPGVQDVRHLPRDVLDHIRFRFQHTSRYSPLQKFSYAGVFFVLFPLIILSGLCMSPGMNAFAPWLVDVFGGRQTARTIHFTVMALLVAFFVVHILMVFAAGPFNELRSMITGWYRTSRPPNNASPGEN